MNFTYIIFDSVETNKIVIDELLVFSAYPIRNSTTTPGKSYLKYIGEMPESVKILESKSQEYTTNEIQDFLKTENWNTEIPF
jgi:hypothetical protein